MVLGSGCKRFSNSLEIVSGHQGHWTPRFSGWTANTDYHHIHWPFRRFELVESCWSAFSSLQCKVRSPSLCYLTLYRITKQVADSNSIRE